MYQLLVYKMVVWNSELHQGSKIPPNPLLLESKNFVLVSTMLIACHTIQHYFTHWACQIWFIAHNGKYIKKKKTTNRRQNNPVLFLNNLCMFLWFIWNKVKQWTRYWNSSISKLTGSAALHDWASPRRFLSFTIIASRLILRGIQLWQSDQNVKVGHHFHPVPS